MSSKKNPPQIKENLHPRNLHRGRYDFDQLVTTCPGLISYVRINEYNNQSVNFFDPEAVKMLNKALLKHFYGVEHWDIPAGYLCPPIPGRADYIHYIADLLGNKKNVRCLDVGMGANCVYPILGVASYNWNFVGADVDKIAIDSATKIVELNPVLKGKIELRLQKRNSNIFTGVITDKDKFDVTICNPPFHSSYHEAQAGSKRKVQNLKRREVKDVKLNFGGKSNELWCKGGELQFIHNMIVESKVFADNCEWFTTLVSKSAHLKTIYRQLEDIEATDIKTIEMGQGNKISRVVAWSFR